VPTTRLLRIFVPSAAALLTDHRPHGEGLIAWNLLSRLALRGHELVVCARSVDLADDPPFELIELGAASRWESIEPLAYARKAARALARAGGANPFDVAHWIFPQGPHELLFTPAVPPLVVGPHLRPWPPRRARARPGDVVRGALAPVVRARHHRTLARASALLASTPEAASTLPGPLRHRVRVLPFGIDESAFPPSAVPDVPTIVFVGRLAREKGIRTLVAAFARVRESLDTARLVVAGDGPERAWVEQQRRQLRLEDVVELVGAVPHSDIPGLLARSSLLCLPSIAEPFGMVVLEAMAAGRAVVADSSAGAAFLVDDARGGYLLPAADAQALADVLVRLLADSDRLVAMGRHNRRKVEQELTWDRVLDELEGVYGEAAGVRRAA
jgi:glycosyltransferase involved in cell wall biosynthesis